MKLWRVTRAPFVALDGAGIAKHGGRYVAAGQPVANLASEAGLAVLIALRYLPDDPAAIADDYVIGWTEIDAVPLRIDHADDDAVRAAVADWLARREHLLASVASKVLPEADVVMLNPRHPAADKVPPLTVRRFSFAECLHRPPMLDRYRKEGT